MLLSAAWASDKYAIRWVNLFLMPISTPSLPEEIQVSIQHLHVVYPVGK